MTNDSGVENVNAMECATRRGILLVSDFIPKFIINCKWNIHGSWGKTPSKRNNIDGKIIRKLVNGPCTHYTVLIQFELVGFFVTIFYGSR